MLISFEIRKISCRVSKAKTNKWIEKAKYSRSLVLVVVSLSTFEVICANSIAGDATV
jgi:hypothetical protein